MSIWMECEGANCSKHLDLEAWRVVEAQHISSSRDLVENREEHDLLEALLENSKPHIVEAKHYLIFTPFRYPPLLYGSRFGSVYEQSLWYGSLSIQTALAEVAYYRLQFFNDTSANLEYIETPMAAFKAYLKTDKGIDLTQSPFNTYQDKIAHKTNYEYSQALGSNMREANIEAFIFASARDRLLGKNVAAFTSDVFIMKNKHYITHMQNWRCIANTNGVEFSRDELLNRKQYAFSKHEF